ncbi:hypothetical protein [Caulobacter vibrioides]|uniref:hypothetical protein n=1 Tax=Caulobacter vibrioides TaxID=155892 RepID=UPI003C6CA3CC
MDVATAIDLLAPRLSPAATGARNVRRLSGGASLETWAFDLSDGTPLILRRRPDGALPPRDGPAPGLRGRLDPRRSPPPARRARRGPYL